MSQPLDLTEAIDVAYAAMTFRGIAHAEDADRAVAAAAPVIERQVRDRIAAEQELMPTRYESTGEPRDPDLLKAEALRIARGEVCKP